MKTICRECARLRDIKMPAMSRVCNCDLCLTRTDCFDIHGTDLKGADIAFERGYLTSDTLTASLALIKSRKAILAPRIKQLQIEVSIPMERIRENEGFTKLSIYDQALTKVVYQNLIGEMSGLEQKEKEYSLRLSDCIDKILITELRTEVGAEKFNAVYERAKLVYAEINDK